MIRSGRNARRPRRELLKLVYIVNSVYILPAHTSTRALCPLARPCLFCCPQVLVVFKHAGEANTAFAKLPGKQRKDVLGRFYKEVRGGGGGGGGGRPGWLGAWGQLTQCLRHYRVATVTAEAFVWEWEAG